MSFSSGGGYSWEKIHHYDDCQHISLSGMPEHYAGNPGDSEPDGQYDACDAVRGRPSGNRGRAYRPCRLVHGGTDILALVLNKYLHLSVAVLMYIVDFSVLGAQALFSDSEQIMYGILALVLETFILNRVMVMGQSQIQLFVISEKYEEVRERMLKEQDVGVTMVHVETGYGKAQRKAALCIIPKRKLYATNELIHSIDEKAFITISQINEVKGRGFTMERVRYSDDEKKGRGEA